MTARVVVFDLDGVLRYWDPRIVADAERRHGLPIGGLAAVAFGETDLLRDAITGRIDDENWRAEISHRLADRHGSAAELAVRDWSRSAGAVVPDVLDVVRDLRAGGTMVALLTNATTRLTGDLRRLRLDRELDVVVGTAALGVAKPDPAAFLATLEAVDAPPHDCVFIDDTAVNVEAAAAMGMDSHRFLDAPTLRLFLDERGLPPRPS